MVKFEEIEVNIHKWRYRIISPLRESLVVTDPRELCCQMWVFQIFEEDHFLSLEDLDIKYRVKISHNQSQLGKKSQ